MSEPQRSPRKRFLRYSLIGVPAALLVGMGLLHAQDALHHMHSHTAQPIDIDHVHAMLAKVGVTDTQQVRIDDFLKAALGEMQATHKALGDAHLQLAGLLLAPTVDRGRVEALRVSQVAALDAASQRMLADVEDAINVLTPEQRAKLAGMHQPHGG
jgi:periplasmic protein CpxP/Spy